MHPTAQSMSLRSSGALPILSMSWRPLGSSPVGATQSVDAPKLALRTQVDAEHQGGRPALAVTYCHG